MSAPLVTASSKKQNKTKKKRLLYFLLYATTLASLRLVEWGLRRGQTRGGREKGLASRQIERPGLKAGMDFRSEVKTGVKIDMFWSEIVLGFGKPGSTPTSRIVTPGKRGAFFASTKEGNAYSFDNPYISILGELPYYRKLTHHEIKVLEINAT